MRVRMPRDLSPLNPRYLQVESVARRLVAAVFELSSRDNCVASRSVAAVVWFPVFFFVSSLPRWLCGSRHHYASCPALSIPPFPASLGIHRPGGDSRFAPDEGARPRLAPDERTRPWDCRPRPPAHRYDYHSNTSYWPKSWASDHPERYRAARAPTTAAGESGSSRGSGVLAIRNQVGDSTGACGRASATSSSADQRFGTFTVRGLGSAFSDPSY